MIINRPPMGWNSWNTFGNDINEKLIFEIADAMVSSGLRDCGYEYIVIDDCWQKKTRNEQGLLEADPEKFPHGMKYVADYIHSKGLKFGMYSCCGAYTCAEFPGSYGHEYADAATFAEWEIDFLKYDYCFRDNNIPSEIHYRKMGLALANCGRDILFSACNFGVNHIENWIKTTGAHMWRSTADIFDCWGSIRNIVEHQFEMLTTNYRGCFNDMDMLVVGMDGNGNVARDERLSFEEYKLHFSAWALFGSPLMIGCDIRNMSEETKAILMNKEVLAVSQDLACNQVALHKHPPYDQFLAWRLLDGGDIAVGVFNMGDEPSINFSGWMLPQEFGWTPESNTRLLLRDLWDGSEKYLDNDIIMECELPPHSCRMFRVSLVKK